MDPGLKNKLIPEKIILSAELVAARKTQPVLSLVKECFLELKLEAESIILVLEVPSRVLNTIIVVLIGVIRASSC